MELLEEFLDSHIYSYLGIQEEDCYYDEEKVVISREDSFSRVDLVKIEDYFEQRPHISDYKISKNRITIWI